MSSGGSKAPMSYSPSWQPGADQSYQGLIQNATPWAANLPGQVIPGLQGVVSNVQNNPYYPGAQQGSNDVAMAAGNQVAPKMFDAANQLYGGAQNTASAIGMYVDPVFQAAQAAYGRGSVLSDRAANMVNGVSKDAIAAAPGALTDGMDRARSMLDTGFDPQSALYDREYQKTMDQQNAINAMYGVAGSAHGAGLAGDQSRNFNIDWQNEQLGRQLSALQGYGNYTGQVTSNYNDLLNGATNRANTLLNTSSAVMNQGVDNLRQGYQTGSNIRSQLTNDATNQYAAASGHAADGLNTLYTSTQLPSSTYLTNQDAQIQALQALAGGGNTALGPSAQMMQALSDYLRLGQSATSINQQGTQINNARAAAGTSSLISGLGTIAGLALAPMTGGMSLFASQALAGANGAAFASLGGQGS